MRRRIGALLAGVSSYSIGVSLGTFYSASGLLPAYSQQFAYSQSMTDTIGGVTATFSRAGQAMQFDHYGLLTYAPNNLFLNSATLSTQGVTVTSINYIVSFKGTGTITLSGASTAGPIVGTGASNRVYLKITPSAGTLTCTVSGSVTEAQIEAVTYETAPRAYNVTTGSAYYSPRYQYDPATLVTSTTSTTPVAGTWTVSSHSFNVGDVVQATDNANAGNYIRGFVTAVTATTVTFGSYTIPGSDKSYPVLTGGSGTVSDWSLCRCDGYLPEYARTNVALHNRDLTDAAWTATNITAAKDQTGIDGVANSASSITASAANGTILQAITLASSARFQTAYVKRLVGSGTIEMTMDNGSTWTAITVTSAWTRVSIPTQTLVNPTVGFRVQTSGDSIAVDVVQNENGTRPSSVILTAAASVTRASDSCNDTGAAAWIDDTKGTFVCDFETNILSSGAMVASDGTTSNRHMVIYGYTGTNVTGFTISAGAIAAQINGGLVTLGNRTKAAYAYATDDFAVSVDGATPVTDTSGTTPAGLTTLGIGYFYPGIPSSSTLFAPIKSIDYYASRASNAKLQELSA